MTSTFLTISFRGRWNSLNDFEGVAPPQGLTRLRSFSIRETLAPAVARVFAAIEPEGPPPTTATSYISAMGKNPKN